MTAREKWLVPLVLALTAAALVVAWLYRPRPTPPAVETVRELAEQRVEDHRTEGKATRRAARARVDKEVRDAAAAGDLADYLRSR